ncbi:MAG: hypothetical protein LDL41_24505 [Coleofasciculus sp. S288]|nr:hypothetical protein [Coleofasciculus sp. S288]
MNISAALEHLLVHFEEFHHKQFFKQFDCARGHGAGGSRFSGSPFKLIMLYV